MRLAPSCCRPLVVVAHMASPLLSALVSCLTRDAGNTNERFSSGQDLSNFPPLCNYAAPRLIKRRGACREEPPPWQAQGTASSLCARQGGHDAV